MAPSSIDWRVRIGRLYRQHSGVYTVGTPPISPLEHAMAAVLACGENAALSHASALCLWGVWKRWDRPLDVIVRTDRRPKGVRVHRNRLDARDVTRRHGIPVTTLARTLLDMAPAMPPKSLNRAVNNGRLEHRLRLDDLADVVRRHPHHGGAKKLQQVLGIATPRPTRSDFERSFPAFCRRYGLPRPEMNFPFGRHELDAFFPEERVIVELDSWEFHSSRTSFEGDREKDAATLAFGLVTVRITNERYQKTPEEEARRLQRILAQRRGTAA
jgi:very-short-patch-repair endonuclease